jgi:hypothetical protein
MAHALALFVLSCFKLFPLHLFILERTLVNFLDPYNYTVEPRVSSALMRCDATRANNHTRITLLSNTTYKSHTHHASAQHCKSHALHTVVGADNDTIGKDKRLDGSVLARRSPTRVDNDAVSEDLAFAVVS